MEQQVRVLQLLQGGLERLHQLVGELADKAHRIGYHHVQRVADAEQAAGGVQGIKETVVGRDARSGEVVEQGGLARIGIANDSHHGDLVFPPLLALGAPYPAHVLQILPQLVNFPVDVPPVRLQLGFAGALGADGTLAAGTRLTLQVGPHAGEPGQQILILGQLHLEPALPGLSPLGKNIQNQPAAVQHLDAQQLGENPHLRG